MKKTVFVIAAAVLMFSGVSAYAADEPTKREWKIYYDYADKVTGGKAQDVPANVEAVLKDNGITNEELSPILNKVYDYGLSPKEKKIYQALEKKLKSMPAGSTFEQKQAAIKDNARKYKISVGLMEEIMVRGVSQKE